MRRVSKTLLLIVSIILSLSVLEGCDALRRLTGRPTSAEIARMRAEHQREEEERAARLDSLEKAQKAAQDSLAALEKQLSEIQAQGTILNPAKMGGLFTTKLDYRYYVVVGAFRVRSNAENLLKVAQKAGYTCTLISFRNGFNAVGMCQTNDLNDALRSLRKVAEEPFSPDDLWILVNE